MLHSDVPILKANEDTLNRRNFAKNLAQVIMDYSAPESFSIGIYGPWGSGKTSVINMVLEAVESASSDIVILRFNPWLCSDSRQLITQFFKQLASAIKLKEKTPDKVWRLIDSYSDILNITGALGTVGAFLSPATSLLTKKAKTRTEGNEKDLQKKKNEIIEHLSKEHIKILVAIDDIDRLSEKEIVAVFQLVKSLADFPNTMYLLAFDHDVVVQALAQVQRGDGVEYLEKIIQVPFALPKASTKNVQDILFSRLNSIISDLPEEKWDKETWAELYQSGIRLYIHSIRDVIRYANVFSLKYTLLKEETDTVDLLGLTCLQVFEPGLYEILPVYQEQLCGNTSSQYSDQEKEKERIQKVIDTLLHAANPKTKEAAENILNLLFPNLHRFSWRSGRTYHHAKFLIHHNVAAPECFTRYFALALDPEEIPSAVIEKLVFHADEIEAGLIMQSISINGNIEKLIDNLQAYCRQCESLQLSPTRAEILLSCLVRQWQTFVPQENMSFFSIPFDWNLLFCTKPLLEVLDAEKRFFLLQVLFSDSNIAIYTLSLLLRDFEIEHNRFVEPPKEHQSPPITLEQVLKLEQIFSDRVCNELEQRTFLQHEGIMQALWLFENIAPELAKEKAVHLVTDDLSLAKLIHHCVGHGKAATRLVYKIWTPNIDSIARYIDLDEALSRMAQFVQQPDFQMLTQSEQEDVAAFLIRMEHRDTASQLSESISAEHIQKKLRVLLPENQISV